MVVNDEKIHVLILEMEKLQERNNLSSQVEADYFEPGKMEFLDKSYGEYDELTMEMVLRFEVMGTRYEGRTPRIENVKIGDVVTVLRDSANEYNTNNFTIADEKGQNLGNLPASLCNALAPLYDEGLAKITGSTVSYVEPVSKRSRYAKQAILFVEMNISLS